jgi:hypothetical protein
MYDVVKFELPKTKSRFDDSAAKRRWRSPALRPATPEG